MAVFPSPCSLFLAHELVPQYPHVDDVPVAAVPVHVLTQAALLAEAHLAVAGDGPLVELEDLQVHPVQVHLLEGEAQQRAQGGGAGVVPWSRVWYSEGRTARQGGSEPGW